MCKRIAIIIYLFNIHNILWFTIIFMNFVRDMLLTRRKPTHHKPTQERVCAGKKECGASRAPREVKTNPLHGCSQHSCKFIRFAMRHSKQQAVSTKRRIHSGKERTWNNVFRCVMNVSRSRACYRSYTFTYRSIHITWLLFCFSPHAWTPVIFGIWRYFNTLTHTHTHTKKFFLSEYHRKCTRYTHIIT